MRFGKCCSLVIAVSFTVSLKATAQPIFFDDGPFYDAVLIDETFVKVKGTLTDTRVFNVVDPTLPLLRIIFQPDLMSGKNSGSVVLNGVTLFASAAFKVDDAPRDTRINKEVPVLFGSNTLEVQIKGKGEGTLRIRILQPTSVAAGTIFVAPPAAGGDDTNPSCGPRATPCATITNGIARAAATAGSQVHVANGVYLENLHLIPGIDLLGGFSTNFSTRDVQGSGTVIHGGGSSLATVVADFITSPTLFEGFIVHGPTVTIAGENSVAVSIVNSTSALWVQNNVIVAGVAGNGQNGESGLNGANGAVGFGGMLSQSGQTTIPGGNGGVTVGAGDGGAGGTSFSPIAGSQNGNGVNGLTSLGGLGGAGGFNGEFVVEEGICKLFLPGGSPTAFGGDPGGFGSEGLGGAGGLNSSGSGTSGTWISASGGAGTAGAPGSGGGGGGAGGGAESMVPTSPPCPANFITGPSGGGGGGGGAGGTEGTGGEGGGGAFGIFVFGGATPPVLTANQIFLGRGGNGGTGAQGAIGGTGRVGGQGGSCSHFGCGDAGEGGPGGDGGPAGGSGGGAGGPSVGIYSNFSGGYGAVNAINTSTGVAGVGGAGGQSLGLSLGADGQAGESGSVLAILEE